MSWLSAIPPDALSVRHSYESGGFKRVGVRLNCLLETESRLLGPEPPRALPWHRRVPAGRYDATLLCGQC